MERNTLIYGLKEFKVTSQNPTKLSKFLFIINIFSIIKFQGLVANIKITVETWRERVKRLNSS